MATGTGYEHIFLAEDGIPTILGTKTKVVEIVLDHLAHGWSPEEIHFQHPSLSMGQIHSALAYYWDHKEEIEREIERRRETADRIEREIDSNPLRDRLKA